MYCPELSAPQVTVCAPRRAFRSVLSWQSLGLLHETTDKRVVTFGSFSPVVLHELERQLIPQ
jgi:hypothetical protein